MSPRLSRRSNVAVVQRQLPRFDLGEVEDVVDHREQGFARVPDGHQVLALLGRQRALEDQFRHADDRVQGRADLVAHVRQERALGAAGGFGRLLGLFQFGVGPRQVRRPLLDPHFQFVVRLRSSCSARLRSPMFRLTVAKPLGLPLASVRAKTA